MSATAQSEAPSFTNESHEEINNVTQSFAPSHILQDGHFVRLPAPTARERTQFFERSIARHGLLEEDLADKKKIATEENTEEEKIEKEPRVHPLALASARLQNDGINELNRIINLNTLVSSGEYFNLSNIVDPSLELPDSKSQTPKEDGAAVTGTTASMEAFNLQEEQRVKATFVLKRKRAQFEKASISFDRHQKRLTAAVVAQKRPDERLRRLRPHWRLVAPEHGTRALAHAPRPTEVVAADVDVYWKGRDILGRLAKRVPRYATLELKEDYLVSDDVEKWETRHSADAMDVDTKDIYGIGNLSPDAETWTRTEPFMIADPTLGKLDTDFDPKKITMLTLRFDIEKPSTGFSQSAALEPISLVASITDQDFSYQEDERMLISLQHSLFCAKLFESIRRELAPDTEDVGKVRTSAKAQSVVWLSSETEENYLPPPSLMARGHGPSGMAPMCVIHCHEGEVKVQLDCEYTLCVRLVEASQGEDLLKKNESGPLTEYVSSESGSQSPAQLLTLCRALSLHAQESYHKYSIHAAAETQKQEEQGVSKAEILSRKVNSITPPRILQSCVNLGSKMLFERRIRKSLEKMNRWLQNKSGEVFTIDWLPLSVFDQNAHFTLSFRSHIWDAYIVKEELTMTSFDQHGNYRKVTFHTDVQLEIFLKSTLQRLIEQSHNDS